MQIALRHQTGTKNMEVAFRFLETFCIPALLYAQDNFDLNI
jgi:hypothetical protein